MATPSRPIRVALDAHVVGHQRTGNETYLVGLAEGLAARSDVEVTAYLDRGMRWPRPNPRISERTLRTTWPQLRIPLELPIRARRDRVDLLHVQYVPPPIAGVPVVTAVHDVSFEDVPELLPTLTRWRLQATVRAAVRTSAVIVTPSSFSRERLLHHYPVDPGRVVVTPPGIRPAANVEPTVQPRDDQRRLPPRFVLCVGDLQPRKNVPRLIEAVARARRAGVELSLVLAGRRANAARQVDQTIEEQHASAWVSQLGYVDDATLAQLYRDAEIVAYPSVYEGFGLPVLEGMARGKPVVAGNRSAIPEVAGDAALLVDPDDAAAMADAICRAATDLALRDRLRTAGLARAAGFSLAAMADSTMHAYRIALEQ